MAKPILKVDIRQKDLGITHFLREAEKIRKKPFVKVGICQSPGSKLHVIENEDGTVTQVKTVADIAQIHEFGAPSRGIPERSFLRSTTTKNDSRYRRHIDELRGQIFDAASGMTTETALRVMGQEISRDIKNTIRKGIAPELKPATIMRKNRRIIAQAAAKVRKLSAKDKLNKSEKQSLFENQEIVDTGGKSTPLINTGQLINSITYEVVMDGEGDASYSGEGPKTY